jgi:hypothetical protein
VALVEVALFNEDAAAQTPKIHSDVGKFDPVSEALTIPSTERALAAAWVTHGITRIALRQRLTETAQPTDLALGTLRLALRFIWVAGAQLALATITADLQR